MTRSRSLPVEIDATAISLSVDRMSAEVVQALEAAAIDAVLLKGPVIVDRLYDPGEHRPYVDCDLLIEASTEPAVASVLRALGFSPDPGLGVPDPGIADQHAWHRRGDHVDLHGSLFGVRAPTAVWPALTERLEILAIGGHRMRVLGDGGLALLLTLHAASDGPAGEKPLEDLRRGLRRLGDAAWDEAADLARRLDAVPAFAAGLRLLPEGADLAERLEIDPGFDIQVALRAAGAPPLAASIERVRREPTLAGKLRRVARALLPTPTYMRRWSPLARRGPVGLLWAYLWRPIWLVLQAGPGALAWSRARRRGGVPRC